MAIQFEPITAPVVNLDPLEHDRQARISAAFDRVIAAAQEGHWPDAVLPALDDALSCTWGADIAAVADELVWLLEATGTRPRLSNRRLKRLAPEVALGLLLDASPGLARWWHVHFGSDPLTTVLSVQDDALVHGERSEADSRALHTAWLAEQPQIPAWDEDLPAAPDPR